MYNIKPGRIPEHPSDVAVHSPAQSSTCGCAAPRRASRRWRTPDRASRRSRAAAGCRISRRGSPARSCASPIYMLLFTSITACVIPTGESECTVHACVHTRTHTGHGTRTRHTAHAHAHAFAHLSRASFSHQCRALYHAHVHTPWNTESGHYPTDRSPARLSINCTAV